MSPVDYEVPTRTETPPTLEAKVRALAKVGYPTGTIARTYHLTVQEVQELCANRAAPPVLPPPPPPPSEKPAKSPSIRPWDPARVHPVGDRLEPRRPLVQRGDGPVMQKLLDSTHAPFPNVVTALKVSDGRIVFEYD